MVSLLVLVLLVLAVLFLVGVGAMVGLLVRRRRERRWSPAQAWHVAQQHQPNYAPGSARPAHRSGPGWPPHVQARQATAPAPTGEPGAAPDPQQWHPPAGPSQRPPR